MKTSQVFRKAKEHILTEYIENIPYGMHYPICFAIDDLNCDKPSKEMACKIVQGRLGGRMFLSGWLTQELGITLDIDKPEQRSKLQRTRHAWLDSLIAEFEAKGD